MKTLRHQYRGMMNAPSWRIIITFYLLHLLLLCLSTALLWLFWPEAIHKTSEDWLARRALGYANLFVACITVVGTLTYWLHAKLGLTDSPITFKRCVLGSQLPLMVLFAVLILFNETVIVQFRSFALTDYFGMPNYTRLLKLLLAYTLLSWWPISHLKDSLAP